MPAQATPCSASRAVLCQVTSKSYGDERAVTIASIDLATGSLRMTSFARPGEVFTANEAIITTTVARVSAQRARTGTA